MSRRNSGEVAMDNLDHKAKVILKRWAGLQGLYGYKSKDLEEMIEFFSGHGLSAYVDYSDPSKRIVTLSKYGKKLREARLWVDEKGKAYED